MQPDPANLETAPPRQPMALMGLCVPARERRLSPDAEVFLPARDRVDEAGTMGAAAFAGGWLFAAVGCFLPWDGAGWLAVVKPIVCLAIWWPVWFLAVQLIAALPGALGLVLESKGVLSKAESKLLISACALVAFSTLALLLASGECWVCEIVGWIWLLVLAAEGISRAIRFLFQPPRTNPSPQP